MSELDGVVDCKTKPQNCKADTMPTPAVSVASFVGAEIPKKSKWKKQPKEILQFLIPFSKMKRKKERKKKQKQWLGVCCIFYT